ncbi:hypothetical protein SALBM217S_05077 [Streptomyces griseoloalbus]
MPADTSTTSTIVLVGHGMVGQRFLEALAERGLTATHRVVVLCEEPRPAYDRVQLTSYFSGRTPEDLSLTDLAFIEEHGIELHLGDPAASVDREARTVTARSGLVVGYDGWCWRPAPTRSCRRCRTRTPRAASSTARSRTSSRSRSTRGGPRPAPWSAETINDPEKLARFVSFVNARTPPTRWSPSSPNATRSSRTCPC